jgi:hypothetical protein
MGKDGQGLRFAVFPHEFVPVLSGLRVFSEEKNSSLGEGPFQMGIDWCKISYKASL